MQFTLAENERVVSFYCEQLRGDARRRRCHLLLARTTFAHFITKGFRIYVQINVNYTKTYFK